MSEKIEIGTKKDSPEMAAFRQDITDWIAKETEKMEGDKWSYNPESQEINPVYLNETDLWIWQRVKSEQATDEDIAKYRARLQNELKSAGPEVSHSRDAFYQLVANKYLFAAINRRRKEKNKPIREREVKDF